MFIIRSNPYLDEGDVMRRTSFDAVIFDMDGVIFDSERATLQCWSELARDYGMVDFENTFFSCIGSTKTRTKDIMLEKYGKDFDYDTFAKEASDIYHLRYDGGRIPVKKGVYELLSFLKERGIRTAVASSTRRQTVESQLKDAGLLHFFDAVICGDMVMRSKPAPDIFIIACEAIGADPVRTYAVEDSYNGIRSACNGGLIPIMVPDMLPANEEMEELAEVILEDLLEVRDYLGKNCARSRYACIDLHLHLDGAVTPKIALKLAKLQNISLPEDAGELERLLKVPKDCVDLNEFLKCFKLPLSLMQTGEGLSEAVRLVCDNILSQGIIYAEIRFAPQLHKQKGMTQEEAVKAALHGLSKTRLKANLILCCMRGCGNEAENEDTLRIAGKYLVKDGGVTAVDLAGAEGLFPTSDYRELFKKAKEMGIPFTIHAGEADGAESVRLAVEFGASRVGHGVRSYEDPLVVELLLEKGITLEMCPTSNRQTHAVQDMREYPFMDYLKRGLKVTLNTDDMGIEGTTLSQEFLYMEENFGLDEKQEKQLFINAVEAAFTSDEVKKELMNRY